MEHCSGNTDPEADLQWSEGSVPGPSRSSFFISDLVEDIDGLLTNPVGYSYLERLGNALGGRVRMS